MSESMTEPGCLETDAIEVRTLREEDADAVAQIDERSIGRSRGEFFRRKIAGAEPGMQMSLAAEIDGRVVGFLMVVVDYGEFGRLEPSAVLDTIGVDPDYRGKLVGTALLRQLVLNLRALNIERIRTEVDWRQWDLLGFLQRASFKPTARLCLEADVNAVPT